MQIKQINKFILIFGVSMLLGCHGVQAQNHPVIQLVNNSGQDALSQLNDTGHFTTNFKGTNDVAITMTNGSVNSVFWKPCLFQRPKRISISHRFHWFVSECLG